MVTLSQLGHCLNDPGSVTSKKVCLLSMNVRLCSVGDVQAALTGGLHWRRFMPARLRTNTSAKPHTHVHTHRYYRWEHSRSVSAMKCWLCFSSHTGHLSLGRLNARPLLSFSLTLVSSWRPLWCSEWTECTVADRTIALCDCTKCHHCLSRQKIKMIPLVWVLAGGRWPELGWLGLRLRSHDWLETSHSHAFWPIIWTLMEPF